MIIVVLTIDYIYFVHRRSKCVHNITPAQSLTCVNSDMCSVQGELFVYFVVTGCNLRRRLTDVVPREDYDVDKQDHNRAELHPFSSSVVSSLDGTTQLQQLICHVRLVRLQVSDSSGFYHCTWDGGRLSPTLLKGMSLPLSTKRHQTEADVH